MENSFPVKNITDVNIASKRNPLKVIGSDKESAGNQRHLYAHNAQSQDKKQTDQLGGYLPERLTKTVKSSHGIKLSNVDEGVGRSMSHSVSQSAKEKRDSYRTKSSGYGTESSQGSCNESQEAFENDVFEDIYTASTQAGVQKEIFQGAGDTKSFISVNHAGNVKNVCAYEERGQGTQGFEEAHMQNGELLSEKGSSTSSSVNSNVTVFEARNLTTANVSVPRDNLLLNSMSANNPLERNTCSHPRTADEDTAIQRHMDNTEYLLSNQEPSFEILLPANNGACAENLDHEVPRTDTTVTDFNSLFDGEVALTLLGKYISEQQNPPIYAPNSECPEKILPNEVTYNQRQTNINDQPSRFDLLSSVKISDDSFCSIVPSNDTHIPLSEMERMFSSAMRRLDKQGQQQDLQKLFTAIDEERFESIFQQMERLGLDSDQSPKDFTKTENASQETVASNMDTIDVLVRQILTKERDLSPEDGTQSTDPSQYTFVFPDQKFMSPQMSFKADGDENRELLLQRLLMAALCLDKTCNNVECSMGQELLAHLQDRLEQNLTYESSSCQQMLKTIAWHAEVCEEIKCPLPYCNFFQETDIPFEEQIARLEQLFYSYVMEITESAAKTDKFWKISARIPVDKALQEGVDWSVVARMGHFGQGPYLVQSSIYQPSTLDMQEYWAVKKIALDEDKVEDKARLLSTLHGIAQDHIIRLLWLLYQQSFLYVCSQFEGMSLSEYLKSREFELGMGRDFTLAYLQQLTSATGYLHSRKILYLNWTCDHVIIYNDRVKLCNLTTAVICNESPHDEDILEDIMMTLPPNVLPPELLELRSLGTYSDIWGLGCIAHEMYCGYKVHNGLRHLDLSSQRSTITKNPVPDLNKITDGIVLNILNKTFQVEHEERPTSSALRAVIERMAGLNR